jgi:N-acyl-D-amino-acid deacylase
LFARIDDVSEKKKIIEALKGYTFHYDSLLITTAKVTEVVGKTVGEIAESAGISGEEALLQIVRSSQGRVTITGHTISLRNTEAAIAHDYSIVASDGAGYGQDEVNTGNLVHPRSFGTFPHFLHRFVNELEKVEIEKAIQKITSAPAEKLGIQKRGVIKKGNFADIVIFDPNIIRDRATYKNPFRFSVGIEWVIGNGKILVENGKFIGERRGAVLRKK